MRINDNSHLGNDITSHLRTFSNKNHSIPFYLLQREEHIMSVNRM